MLYFSEVELVQRLWSGAVAKQILLAQRVNIPMIHHCCFPHLQSLLSELTDEYIEFHLDLEKHKDLALLATQKSIVLLKNNKNLLLIKKRDCYLQF